MNYSEGLNNKSTMQNKPYTFWKLETTIQTSTPITYFYANLKRSEKGERRFNIITIIIKMCY